MEWLYLLVAGILEVTWAVFIKMSDGFTKVMPSIITGIGGWAVHKPLENQRFVQLCQPENTLLTSERRYGSI